MQWRIELPTFIEGMPSSRNVIIAMLANRGHSGSVVMGVLIILEFLELLLSD
jgi:hypothetical protein